MLECLCVRLAVALDYHSAGDTLLGVDDAPPYVGHCWLSDAAELAASAIDLVVSDVEECWAVVFSVVVALCRRVAYSDTGSVLRARMAEHLHFPSNLVARVADLSYATNSIVLHVMFLCCYCGYIAIASSVILLI